MRFTPLPDEELNAKKFPELSAGLADFEITKAEDTTSKAGQPMLKLTIKVWDCMGKEGLVWDYITANAQWKLKGLLAAIGRVSVYDTGNCDAQEVIGGIGKCVIKITTTDQHGTKASIENYTVPNNKKEWDSTGKDIPIKPTAPELPPFDASEDVPF